MIRERRTVVVTGANRGIGYELARQLAARGELVVVTARTLAKAQAAADSLPAGSHVLPAGLDVTSDGDAAALEATLREHTDRVDVLINNAAIHYDTGQRAVNADLRIVREALETNVIGAWRTTLALLSLLRASAHGRIVNVSSGAGSLQEMSSGTPAYRVSKAALNALTRTLAADLSSEHLLVNSVCPGWVRTDMGGAGGRPVGEGAASVLWAADLPDDGPTGGFFRDGLPIAF
jgi:NAD(P)-dependent dehydrogenase (short-subunit alcohol dehydrogenase family)